MNDPRRTFTEHEDALARHHMADSPFDLNAARAKVSRNHRLRALRTTSIAAAAIVALTAVGLVGWNTRPQEPAQPTIESAPTPSTEPSPTTSPSASASPVEEPQDWAVPVGDPQAIARWLEPTTGETWHEPAEYQVPAEWGTVWGQQPVGLAIGTVDGGTLVAVGFDHTPDGTLVNGLRVEGLVFVESGTAVLVGCPSADDGAPCVIVDDPFSGEQGVLPGLPVDVTIHLDSLTTPDQFDLPSVGVMPAAPLGDEVTASAYVGTWIGFEFAPGRESPMDSVALVAPIEGAPVSVVERASEHRWLAGTGLYPQYVHVQLGVSTQYNGIVEWQDAPGRWFDRVAPIAWNDGRDTFVHAGRYSEEPIRSRPISFGDMCEPSVLSLADESLVNDWVPQGTTAVGSEVRVPADPQDPLVAALYQSLRDMSEEGTPGTAFRYRSAAEFVESRAIMAIRFDDARWVIAIDSDARVHWLSCV